MTSYVRINVCQVKYHLGCIFTTIRSTEFNFIIFKQNTGPLGCNKPFL